MDSNNNSQHVSEMSGFKNNSCKLSAIMFTDIKGFSRRMGENERFTLKLLRDHNRIMRFLVRKHRGRIVKSTGDGYLMDFDSAVEAVQCGIEAQERFTRYNFDKPESDQIHVRMGINLGEVRIVDGDLFGDEVNIAARLQTLAEPSGICITREVYEMVKTKLTIVAVNFGPQELKNICQRVEVFKVLIKPLGHAAIEIAPNRMEKLHVTETQTFMPFPVESPANVAVVRQPVIDGRSPKPSHLFKPFTSRRSLRRALPLVTLGILLPALFFQPGIPQRGLSSASLASIQQMVPDTLQRMTSAATEATKTSLLVTYFDNRTGDQRDEWLTAGLTDMIITDMQGVSGLQVLGRAALEDAMQAAGNKSAQMNLKFARTVAQKSASDLVLSGSIVRDGNVLRFDVQVFNTRSGDLLLAEKVTGGSVLQMVTDLTIQLKTKLEPLSKNDLAAAQK